jgi:hypothetical protein
MLRLLCLMAPALLLGVAANLSRAQADDGLLSNLHRAQYTNPNTGDTFSYPLGPALDQMIWDRIMGEARRQGEGTARPGQSKATIIATQPWVLSWPSEPYGLYIAGWKPLDPTIRRDEARRILGPALIQEDPRSIWYRATYAGLDFIAVATFYTAADDAVVSGIRFVHTDTSNTALCLTYSVLLIRDISESLGVAAPRALPENDSSGTYSYADTALIRFATNAGVIFTSMTSPRRPSVAPCYLEFSWTPPHF